MLTWSNLFPIYGNEQLKHFFLFCLKTFLWTQNNLPSFSKHPGFSRLVSLNTFLQFSSGPSNEGLFTLLYHVWYLSEVPGFFILHWYREFYIWKKAFLKKYLFFPLSHTFFLYLRYLIIVSPYVFLFYLTLNLQISWASNILIFLLCFRLFRYGIRWVYMWVQFYFLFPLLKNRPKPFSVKQAWLFIFSFPCRLAFGFSKIMLILTYIYIFFPGFEFLTLWVVFSLDCLFVVIGAIINFLFKRFPSQFAFFFLFIYSFLPILLNFLSFIEKPDNYLISSFYL